MLVFGAGEGAEQVITAMLRDPDSPYLPVAMLDDDPRKAAAPDPRRAGARHPRRHRRGRRATSGAEVLLIAVPSADGALVRELAQLGDEAGLQGAGGARR